MKSHHNMSSCDMAAALDRYGKKSSSAMLEAVAARLRRNYTIIQTLQKQIEQMSEPPATDDQVLRDAQKWRELKKMLKD